MFETFRQDTWFAMRLLWKSPLFTLTAVLSIAIGIGANATIFSIGSALLLRPMPGITDPDRVVDIGRHRGDDGFDTVSYPNYIDIRERATSFSGVYAYMIEPTPMSLGGTAEAERVYGTLVSANYFDVLGVGPHIGRMFRPDEDHGIGAHPVVVLSHDMWTVRYASDPTIVGQQITINGVPFTVVGVAPRGFQGTTALRADVWVPLSMAPDARPSIQPALFTSRRSTWLFMGGRVKPGVSIAQADAELSSIAAALEEEHPAANERFGLRAQPSARIPGMTQAVAGFVGLLMGIVTMLLLIACANLAGMLLARGAVRTREMAVRLAIGAGHGRIVQQLLTESVVLFVLGAAGGLLLSRWLTASLLAVLPQLPFPVAVSIPTDWRVLLFTAGLSLAAAVLCGLAPALQARRTSLVPALKSEAVGGPTSALRLRSAFVVGQVMLSLVLVVAAGLFMRALERAASTPTGFDSRNVDVISLDLSLARYDAASGRLFARELLERTRELPGVEAAALAVDLPLDGGDMGFGRLSVPGAPGGLKDGTIPADWNLVEPGFFGALRMRLVTGRDFTDADRDGAPPVVIVNEAFARAAWGTTDVLGRQVEVDRLGSGGRLTVVGVLTDARFRSLGEPASPYVFAPLAQTYHSNVNLLVRSADGRRGAIADVRALVRGMNRNLPVTEALSLEDATALGTIPQRVAGAIAGTLGLVGLLLAAMGIYGVTAYAVNRRMREIGIRVALGADRRQVMRVVLAQGIRLAAIGITVGLLLSAVAGQFLGALLLGVGGADPLTFSAAAMLFGFVSTLATYLPARRALQVEPTIALRAE